MLSCDECLKSFEVNSSLLKRERVNVISAGECEESITLSYIDCPYCGKRHFVQIDNEETKSKLDEMIGILIPLKYRKKKKKKIAKYKAINKYLNSIRTKLMIEYSGIEIVMADCKKYEIQFSVVKIPVDCAI